MKTLTTADELTAINAGIRKERTLANIARRASTLFNDGYTATKTLDGCFVNCYVVRSPQGKVYTVKVSQVSVPAASPTASRCSCPCFAELGSCKHLQALELQEDADASDEAQCAEYEALYGDAAVDAAIGGRTDTYGACRYSDY